MEEGFLSLLRNVERFRSFDFNWPKSFFVSLEAEWAPILKTFQTGFSRSYLNPSRGFAAVVFNCFVPLSRSSAAADLELSPRVAKVKYACKAAASRWFGNYTASKTNRSISCSAQPPKFGPCGSNHKARALPALSKCGKYTRGGAVRRRLGWAWRAGRGLAQSAGQSYLDFVGF